MMLGRAAQGDATARHGYGPPVFKQCGYTCAYCGFEMGAAYEAWLQLSVDHVVPMGTRSKGYRVDWLEDVANQVTCCRPCNEFLNAFLVSDPPPTDEAAFFDLRDRVFREKRALALAAHARERDWYAQHVDPTP
jgi:hypothetical protein